MAFEGSADVGPHDLRRRDEQFEQLAAVPSATFGELQMPNRSLEHEGDAEGEGRIAESSGQGDAVGDLETSAYVDSWTDAKTVIAEVVKVHSRLAEHGPLVGQPEIPLHDHGHVDIVVGAAIRSHLGTDGGAVRSRFEMQALIAIALDGPGPCVVADVQAESDCDRIVQIPDEAIGCNHHAAANADAHARADAWPGWIGAEHKVGFELEVVADGCSPVVDDTCIASLGAGSEGQQPDGKGRAARSDGLAPGY